MNDYLMLWAEEILKRPRLTVNKPISVTGERDQHLGPRWEFARIKLSVQPAPSFEVVDTMPEDDALRRVGYPDWAIFGLLDILMFHEPSPLCAVRVILEDVEYHQIDSSPIAFLKAGRDAGRKIVEAARASHTP